MEAIKGYVYAVLGKGRRILKVVYETLKCKFCGSHHIVRFGTFRGIISIF